MIVKCKKCETKLKVSDDKLTAEGLKVKCPKCASVLLVKKHAEQPDKKKDALQKESGVTLKVVPPLSIKEENAPQEEPLTTPLQKEEPSLAMEKEPAQALIKEEKILSAEAEKPYAPPAPVEAKEEVAKVQEESLAGFDDTFALKEEIASQKVAEEQPTQAPIEEGFKIELPTDEALATGKPQDEFQLDTTFDFRDDGEKKQEVNQAGETALAGAVEPGEEPFEVMQTSTPAPVVGEAGGFLREPSKEATQEPPAPPIKPAPEQAPPAPHRKPTKSEVTGYGVSTRRSMPITPIILVILIAIAIYVAYKKIQAVPREERGSLTCEGLDGKFIDNEKEGKMFVITGKVRNEYETDRSFIQVKGVLYDKDGKEVAAKVVYAGNIPTETECRKLPMEEIDKLLNVKMGEELSNMNVIPGASINFKIVFSNVDEQNVDKFNVVGAGSQPAYK